MGVRIRLVVVASLALLTAACAPVEPKPAVDTPRSATPALSPSSTAASTIRAAVGGTADTRATAAAPAVPGAICDFSGTTESVIKGNVATDGEHIYHVPGGAFYAATVISATRGERTFCTEADARAAGWRKSLR